MQTDGPIADALSAQPAALTPNRLLAQPPPAALPPSASPSPGLQIDAGNVALHQRRLDYERDALGALLAQGAGKISQRDVIDSVTGAVRDGMLDPQSAAASLGSLPSDPSQIQVWVQQKYLQTVAAQRLLDGVHHQAAAKAMGAPSTASEPDPAAQRMAVLARLEADTGPLESSDDDAPGQADIDRRATALAAQQSQLLETPSDPAAGLSRQGHRGVVALLKGNEQALAVKRREWRHWLAQGHGPASYGAFSAAFAKQVDPRVFQLAHLDPRDAQARLAAMDPAVRKTLAANLRTALQRGWTAMPGGDRGGQ